MRKKTIVIDMDDTITCETLTEIINEYLGTNYKDKDFEEIDKQVEDIVMRVLKASQISHRNPDKIDSYKISSLNEWIYDERKWDHKRHEGYGKDGLLRVYSKYTEYFQNVRKGEAYNFQIEGLKSCKEKLIDIIKKIDNELKLLGL